MSTTNSATYTHVGRKADTGSYKVTADAWRKPGRTHALNALPGSVVTFVGLCGERVALWSGDHFMQGEPQASPGHRITCRRCLKRIRTP